MSKKLYLMRHAETLFNQLHRIQGWCDSPLTENGIAQAKNASKYFQDITIDHAYSSTSERCCDTLELALGADFPYKRVKDLREMGFGVFEGESEVLNPKNPEESYPTFFLPYGGEASPAVGQRMLKALTEIMEQPDNQNVLAVSSGGACRNFLRAAEVELHLLKRVPNCGIFVLNYDDHKFSLEKTITE